MKINEKSTLWSVLDKYDNTELVNFTNSLSKVIQSKETDEDLSSIFFAYQLIDQEDAKLVDSILGKKILNSLN